MKKRRGTAEVIKCVTNMKEFRNTICHEGKPRQEQNSDPPAPTEGALPVRVIMSAARQERAQLFKYTFT